MADLDTVFRALNEAASVAARAARRAGHPAAAELVALSTTTDRLVDALPPRLPHACQIADVRREAGL
ncbi:MAG: hypothetical protein ACK4IA_16355 [Paracoccus hibiscisoli]|uniref:hypothetical protein n=1 Tax=Paracoccus hibiscisoli TaxID=2023261 RepID=UPI003919CA92